VEFRGDLWHPKTRVPGLSCDVVCVILRLAVLAELRFVTDGRADGRTDRRTDGHTPMVFTARCYASRGKNHRRAAKMTGSILGNRYDDAAVTRILVLFTE